jgi:replicative DNA helicase
MGFYEKTLSEINYGKQGLNGGIPFGIPSLVPFVPNIQKSTYFLLGGETGSSKTALTDHMFVQSPCNYVLNNITDIDLKIQYFSFEISIEEKISKFICQKIFEEHKILVDTNYILSRGKNRISEEVYSLVLNTRIHFEKLEDIIEVHDLATNATGITKKIESFSQDNFNKIQTGEFTNKDGSTGKLYEYEEKNHNAYRIVILDHVGLIKGQKDLLTKKDRIDYVSSNLIEYRNKYKIIPVIVSQFNRSLASAERELSVKNNKPDYSKIKPQLSDFKDSGGTQEDANVVMSVFSPFRYGIPEYNGYNTKVLGDRVRFLDVLKSRSGLPSLSKGLGHLGEIGKFIDLPTPDKMTSDMYNYFTHLKKQI